MFTEYTLSGYSPLVARTVSSIRQQFTSPIALEEIADNLGVSKEHLSRRLREETGFTVTEFIHRTKISESLELVNSGSCSIENIAEIWSFCNAGYYGLVFKKVMGMTAMEYRMLGTKPMVPSFPLSTGTRKAPK